MKTYEMNWDCGGCGTKGLLGKTHRHCPVCGMPQDPDKRYFPQDDQKVAVEDHPFVGADKRCRACDAPVVATAGFCGVCGSPTDASREAKRREDVVLQDGAVQPSPGAPPAPAATRSPWPWIVGAVVVVGVGIGLMTYSSEAQATLTGRQWSRSIEVETYTLVETGAWRDELPAGVVHKGCAEKERSTRDVPDGETCTTTKSDQGDGTFTEKTSCKPKFKKEPVMGDWCRYDAPKWVTSDTAQASGTSAEAPAWPTVRVTGCASLGCTREGARKETYRFEVTAADGKAQSCDVDAAVWNGLHEGQAVVVGYGLAGGLSCADIHAAP